MTLAISIDVGGTLTKSGIVADDGRILCELSEPTALAPSPEGLTDHVVGLLQRLLGAAGLQPGDVAGACIGLPGIVEHKVGQALSCPNLRAWEGVPIPRLVTERTGIPLWIEKDANLAALGESWLGAARGTAYSICLTLGTGIGAGTILDGRIYHGAWGGAGEIGHITMVRDGPRCGCGNRGCLEALASATAIVREGQAAADRAPESLLWTLAHGERGNMTADVIFQAAAQGDMNAARVIDTAMEYLGLGVASMINMFNPDLVVIGGGLAGAGSQVLAPVRSVVRQRGRQPLVTRTRIELAGLGNRAGVLGGAYLVFTAG
jgi:glucokinase